MIFCPMGLATLVGGFGAQVILHQLHFEIVGQSDNLIGDRLPDQRAKRVKVNF